MVDHSQDFSNFTTTQRNRSNIDRLPPRVKKFWDYLHTLRKSNMSFIIISRERACFDLGIKDSTLDDYIVNTKHYKHFWTSVGNFINLSTIYGGYIMVIFAGYRYRDIHQTGEEVGPAVSRLNGQLFELTDDYKYKVNRKLRDANNAEVDTEAEE